MPEVAMMMLFRDIPPIERSKIRLMNQHVSNDQHLQENEDAEKADRQKSNRPNSGYHWRFRVAAGLFGAWLVYLGWVVWKVVVQ